VIHGHHHNNDLRHYPFIDFEHRRVNVSAEVIGYIPVSLKDICELIRGRVSRGDMTPIQLKYPFSIE
jgi:calcineurin-like phosphoesterase family protein